MNKYILAAAAALATITLASPAVTLAAPSPQHETTQAGTANKRVAIPFVATNGVYSWQVGPDNSLLIEAHHNDWYKATFQGYCPPLKLEMQVGIIANPMGDFDRFSKVIVDDRVCFVNTLEHIKAPGWKETGDGSGESTSGK